MEYFVVTEDEAKKLGFELMTDEEAEALLGTDWDTAPDTPEEGGMNDEPAAARRTE